MPKPTTLVFALLLATTSAVSFAQADRCAMVPENMRARCLEAMKVKEKCAGLAGQELKECQQKNVNYGATKENCAPLAGDAKARCELHNRNMEAASPCSGKTGADLEKCTREAAAPKSTY